MATILIIEDNRANMKLATLLVRNAGHTALCATDAETGLREAEKSHPDAIILDLRMPLLDGLGFLRRLRAREAQRHTPVAIVTGDYFLDDLVSAELTELGAELKFKPLWLEDLVGLARHLLRVTH